MCKEIKRINTNLLAEKFRAIKGTTNKENDFLFNQIRQGMDSDKNIYNEEDILGICVMSVLKKCSWLNLNSESGFNNVNDFISLFFKKFGENISKHDDKEFYQLSSIIIKLAGNEFKN